MIYCGGMLKKHPSFVFQTTSYHILPNPTSSQHPAIQLPEAHKKRREAKAKAGMDWVAGLGF